MARLLDEDEKGIAVSIFPRLIFNTLQSPVRRGLAEDGTRAQLPIEFAKKFGPIELGLEWGARQ